MTICNLDGNLKYNVYGQNWDSRKSNRIAQYKKVIFVKDLIFASYSGNNNFSDEALPTRIIVFDINGDYIKTLETSYKICEFCYDQENNRIILCLDAEM